MVQLVIKVFLIMLHIMEADYRESEIINHLGRNMIEMVKEGDVYLIDKAKLDSTSGLSGEELIEYYKYTGKVLNHYKYYKYRNNEEEKVLYSLDLTNNDEIGYTSLYFVIHGIEEKELSSFISFFQSYLSSETHKTQFEGGEAWTNVSDNNMVSVRYNREDKKLKIFSTNNYEQFIEHVQIGPIYSHYHDWGSSDNVDR